MLNNNIKANADEVYCFSRALFVYKNKNVCYLSL